jgi:hypothetical protein
MTMTESLPGQPTLFATGPNVFVPGNLQTLLFFLGRDIKTVTKRRPGELRYLSRRKSSRAKEKDSLFLAYVNNFSRKNSHESFFSSFGLSEKALLG